MVISALLDSILHQWAALAKTLYCQARECIDLFQAILSLEAELSALESH